MRKFIEQHYFNLPLFMQDALCSAYGLYLYRQRYGGAWKHYYSRLLESEKYDLNKIEELQGKLFCNLIKYACQHVPYYRKNLASYNIVTVEAWREALNELPLLDKDVVRRKSEQFVSDFYERTKLIKLNTSGTTGTPLTVYVAPEARQLNYAFFARSKKWAGVVGKHVKSATFAGRTIVPPNQKKPPFWRKNFIANNTLFSSYHLSESNLGAYVEKLTNLQPVFIDSYPSSIAIVAEYCLNNHITSIKPQAVITSAETLFAHQREKIENAFGCNVFDQYGCTEQAVFACQCAAGQYHVNPEYGLLEVVDDGGNVVPDGTVGEFVCTGFTNKAMPLIRYKIGDMGALSTKKCACGSNFPVIEKIMGRADDALITPDGRLVGRLDPVFKGVASSIKETQIVQQSRELISIRIVQDSGYKPEHGEYIVKELVKRMGNDIQFQIVFVEEIPRTKSGKYRAVVNEINST